MMKPFGSDLIAAVLFETCTQRGALKCAPVGFQTQKPICALAVRPVGLPVDPHVQSAHQFVGNASDR